MTCSIDGCGRPAWTRGWCGMHYQRWRTHGAVGPAGPLNLKGAATSNWKGGRTRGGTKGRYWLRYVPDHPAATATGYVLEHRLVMEERLGRYLTAEEVVHHINGDPLDNRDENLELFANQSEHMDRHRARAKKELVS